MNFCEACLLVLWFQRNDSHAYEDANGDLHIVDVRKVDSGRYTCTAVNPLGQDAKDIQVDVEGARALPANRDT